MKVLLRFFTILAVLFPLGILPASADPAGWLVVNSSNNIISTSNLCSSQTVYIDPSASVKGNGTLGLPYNNWGMVAFKPGGCYLQKAGTTSTAMVNISVQGSAASPVLIGAYGSGMVPVVQNSINLDNASYVIVQGLLLTQSSMAAVIIQHGSNHVLIANNSISNAFMGVWIGNSAGSSNVISGNSIFSNSTFGVAVDKVDNPAGQETAIINNFIYNNGSHGIELEGNRYNVVNNTVYGNGRTVPGSSGIHLYAGGYQGQAFVDEGSFNYISGNAVYGNLDGQQDGNGIDADQHTHDNIIVNNFAFDNDGAGIVVFDSWNNQIQHNVCLNNGVDSGHSHLYHAEMLMITQSSSTNWTNNNTLLENAFIAVAGNVNAVAGDDLTANNPQTIQNNYLYNTAGSMVYSWGQNFGSSETVWNSMTAGGNKFSGLSILQATSSSPAFYSFKFSSPYTVQIDGKSIQLSGWNGQNGLIRQ